MSENRIIEKFREICESIGKTPHGLTEAVLDELLDYIEDNPILINVVKDATKDFNYYKIIKEAEYGYDNNFYLKMPEEDGAKIALTVGVLHDFREGVSNITNFVSKFYKDKNIEQSHKKFYEGAIIPFCRAFINMLTEENETEGEKLIETVNHIECFPKSAKSEIKFWIREVIEIIAIDKSLSQEDRQDYATLLEGFDYVLERDDMVLLELLWTANKRVLKSYKKGKMPLREIDNIVKRYKII